MKKDAIKNTAKVTAAAETEVAIKNKARYTKKATYDKKSFNKTERFLCNVSSHIFDCNF